MIVGRPAGALIGQPRQRGQHRGHRALDVARAAAKYPAVAHFRTPGGDRHAVHRHGVLVGLEENQRTADLRRRIAVDPGDNIVALRLDGLPCPRPAEPLEKGLQVIRHAVFEKNGSRAARSHRIDARNGDQIAGGLHSIEHGGKVTAWAVRETAPVAWQIPTRSVSKEPAADPRWRFELVWGFLAGASG